MSVRAPADGPPRRHNARGQAGIVDTTKASNQKPNFTALQAPAQGASDRTRAAIVRAAELGLNIGELFQLTNSFLEQIKEGSAGRRLWRQRMNGKVYTARLTNLGRVVIRDEAADAVVYVVGGGWL